MLDYQKLAMDNVRASAKTREKEHLEVLKGVCGPFFIDVSELIRRVLERPVTVNFHPDRLSNNGKTVIENLLDQGLYHGQFRTGTTNGGKSAHPGGDRFLWEQRLFGGAYPEGVFDRPKYGALNLLRYTDGASVRFGSCYLVLNRAAADRCTFAYGDSSLNPTTLCTSDHFAGVLADLFRDVKTGGKLLDRAVSSEREALAVLLNAAQKGWGPGRNLDHCIEAHIHGDLSLGEDADALFLDESFRETKCASLAEAVCRRYGLRLGWIPKRELAVGEIGELFRGPKIPPLAQRIDRDFGRGKGMVHAELIGRASRDSTRHPEDWLDMGDASAVFQSLKQLWHTVGYFG